MYCVDLMNRCMHNFISRNASISHFTGKKKKKRKLETRDSGYRVFSSWKSVRSPSFLLHSHISRTVDSCTDFPCQNFVIIFPLPPPRPCCRDLFLFCFVLLLFVCFVFFISIPFFAVTLHRLLCM